MHQALGMWKLCATRVPHSLNRDRKQMRKRHSQQCLYQFDRSLADFVQRFVIMFETRMHHCTPETKQQSKQWEEAGVSEPKKSKSIASAGKVMASVSWDAKGITLKKAKQLQANITLTFLTSWMSKFARRCLVWRRKNFFTRTTHESALAMRKLRELRYDLLDHPPYFPDLVPSDFHLFPNLK